MGMLPPIILDPTDVNKAKLLSNPTVTDVIGLPINLLVDNRKLCTGATHIKHRCWSTAIPQDGIQTSELDVDVSSPLFTLLQLSSTLSLESLTLIAYELSGRFTIFEPTAEIEEVLKPFEERLRKGVLGWRRVYESNGKPSNLWMRNPLITLEELSAFVQETKGMYGNRKLAEATRLVTGVTLSPFEAQLSLLLSLPRSIGGEGLSNIANNYEIRLSDKARKLCSKRKVYVDLHLSTSDGKHDLAIECQGRISHGTGGIKDGDAERATALQAMGYDVMLITYQQISHRQNFDALRRLIFEKLEMPYIEKNKQEREAELNLRRKLFVKWEDLGKPELLRTRKGIRRGVSVPLSQTRR